MMVCVFENKKQWQIQGSQWPQLGLNSEWLECAAVTKHFSPLNCILPKLTFSLLFSCAPWN